MSSNITPTSIKSPIAPTWCPGCGDFLILNSIQKALSELNIKEENVVLLYGIGCSGNMADFNRAYGFHALHGRALPAAIGMKLANKDLKIIAIGGDGDMYGEGFSHFIATARGNHDVTMIVHNNARYSLTTGQSSPTTEKGTKTKSTPQGLIEKPINPLAMALTAKASFVSRSYSSKPPQMSEIIKAAIEHPGFSLVDVLQLCPTFNKKQNHPWFADKIYDLDETHDSSDPIAAYSKAIEHDDMKKFPLGILYQDKKSVPYHKYITQIEEKSLVEQWSDSRDIGDAMRDFV